MGHSFLKLNENETEIIMFGSPTASVDISSVLGPLTPYKKKTPRGAFFDLDLKFGKQIHSAVSVSFDQLRIIVKVLISFPQKTVRRWSD